MTKTKIQELVDEGCALDQEIKPKEKRLKEIRELLAEESKGNPCEMAGTDCKASITFAARIEGALYPEKEAEAKELAGSFFNKLFCRRPIEDFAKVAVALLPMETSTKLIKLLMGAPGPRISFKKDPK